ncbi:Hypothetical Protein FCC1311_069282 [Hondaea fermentalgiana]|uniref:DGQHR domain-containing protein n=1 Tax=Hondaea fermentalgiana TaxID=2315210 RepID=A0A2R5GLU3_9STRA|nr:Hypothetical Protein FCC1311_069282 [Hondaea fermentalgiana]|eukprot:GBG30708.1 Hypothetical Protein FCC1311_069282 [Hondaea fermentalgiana]
MSRTSSADVGRDTLSGVHLPAKRPARGGDGGGDGDGARPGHHGAAQAREGDGAPRGEVSPLVELLERGVAEHTLVRSPDGAVYTGFADFATLNESECLFRPMNSNRAINDDVVRERVAANERRLKESGTFYDFGQINFIINNQEPSKTFFIMDGQHRCATMARLLEHKEPINFQFRVKVVNSEQEAASELEHFQNSYPSDPRSFFPTQHKTTLATQCLEIMKATFPGADLWRTVEVKSRVGARTGDPNRPFLTDFIFFGLLQTSGLLDKHDDAEPVLETLITVDKTMADMGARKPSSLGKGVSREMVAKARALGCFLGFFRPGKLEWHDVAAQAPLR